MRTFLLKYNRPLRASDKIQVEEVIVGLEWLPETSLSQDEWNEAQSIAAFLVDD